MQVAVERPSTSGANFCPEATTDHEAYNVVFELVFKRATLLLMAIVWKANANLKQSVERVVNVERNLCKSFFE